jgi:hypothetical protein
MKQEEFECAIVVVAVPPLASAAVCDATADTTKRSIVTDRDERLTNTCLISVGLLGAKEDEGERPRHEGAEQSPLQQGAQRADVAHLALRLRRAQSALPSPTMRRKTHEKSIQCELRPAILRFVSLDDSTTFVFAICFVSNFHISTFECIGTSVNKPGNVRSLAL